MTSINRQEQASPRTTIADAPDAIDTHAVHDSDLKRAEAELPHCGDFKDFHFGETGAVVVLAASRAPLCRHVVGVVLQRSEKEMGGVAAPSNVASMAHKQAGLDRPESEGPRYSVRKILASIEPRASVSSGQP